MTLSDIKFKYEDKIDSINNRVNKYQEIIQDYTLKIKKAQQEENPNVSSVVKAKKDYERRIDNMLQVKKYYQEFVDTADSLMQSINGNNVLIWKMKYENLVKEHDDLKSYHLGLENDVENYSANIQSLTYSLNYWKGKNTKKEYTIRALNAENKRLKEKIKKVQYEDIKELKDKLQTLEAERANAYRYIKKLENKEKMLKKKKKELDKRERELDSSNMELLKRNQRLEDYCNHLLSRTANELDG